jgi:hypothetical protein
MTYLYGIDYKHPSYVILAGLLLQISASMGVKIHADILSIESFAKLKPLDIAKTAFVENVVQILFVVSYFNDDMRIIKFALGTMTVVLALTFGMVILGYPSSERRKSLKEASEKIISEDI